MFCTKAIIGHGVLEKRTFNGGQYIDYFSCFSIKEMVFYKVWLKLAEWFWRRRFLDAAIEHFLFRYYLSWTTDFCQVWLKWPSAFGEV